MSIQTCFKSLTSTSRRWRRLRPSAARPSLEPLEDRCLLSFGLAANYDVGYPPIGVDVGDFNGDGLMDVATTGFGIEVLLNSGAGSLADAVVYPIGSLTAVVGDLNGDGNLDLAAITTTSRFGGYWIDAQGNAQEIYVSEGHVKVLLGNGTGSFTATNVTYDLGDGRQFDAVLADLDEDGDLDLATSNLDGYASILLGNGDGTFAPRQAVPVLGTRDVDLADLNGDGHVDLIASSDVNNIVRVALGNGNGTFQTAQAVATFTAPGGFAAVGAQAVGDINGDGTFDLAITYNVGYVSAECGCGTAEGYVHAMLGNGDGTFAEGNSYLIGPGPDGIGTPVELADFDEDGNLDIVASGPNNGYVALLTGNGDGTFNAPELSPLGLVFGVPNDIAVADLDGNGSLDIATANYWNTISVLLNGVSPLPTLSISDVTVAEGNTGTRSATFTVTLSAASSQAVTVAYASADRGAAAGSDHQATSGTLTFAPGETLKTISVLVNGDRLGEPNETFVVNLSSPSNATIADGQGLGVIQDDEPWITINDVAHAEANSGVTAFPFTVSLSAAYDLPVTIDYATFNGAATAGSDYQPTGGTLTIPADQTSGTITVLVNGDPFAEPNEVFFVNLSSATNATIADREGLGIIVNDDLALPTLGIGDVTITEVNTGTRSASFTVTLSAASSQPVTVAYATDDGSAAAGSDYQAASGTLTIPAGQTAGTITVLVNGDRNFEPNETLSINLTSPTNATIADGQGVGTIMDDEPCISISDVTKNEGNGKKKTLFVFTVTLSAAYDQAVTMSYRTVDGTATTGDNDYIARTGTLTFAPGETTKTVTVEIRRDGKREATEYFYLELFGNSSNALLTKYRGIGTILNDD